MARKRQSHQERRRRQPRWWWWRWSWAFSISTSGRHRSSLPFPRRGRSLEGRAANQKTRREKRGAFPLPLCRRPPPPPLWDPKLARLPPVITPLSILVAVAVVRSHGSEGHHHQVLCFPPPLSPGGRSTRKGERLGNWLAKLAAAAATEEEEEEEEECGDGRGEAGEREREW